MSHMQSEIRDREVMMNPKYSNMALRYIGWRTIENAPVFMTDSSFLCSPKTVLRPEQAKRREEMKNGSEMSILRWDGKDCGWSIDVWMMSLSISRPAMKSMRSMIWPVSPKGCSPARSFLCSWVFILFIF